MKKVYLSIIVLVSGCAHGSVVPASYVDYESIFDGIECELWNVVLLDEHSKSRIFVPIESEDKKLWKVAADVELSGSFASEAGLGVGVSNYGIGGSDSVSVQTSLSRKFTDEEKIVLNKNYKLPDEVKCGSKTSYSFSKIGLQEWFSKISSKINSDEEINLIRQFKYTREANIKFGPSGISFSFLSPVKIGPKFGADAKSDAKITLLFERRKPKGNATVVSLDKQSILDLAKALRGGSIDLRSSDSQDDELNQRMLNRELESITDQNEALQNLLEGQPSL